MEGEDIVLTPGQIHNIEGVLDRLDQALGGAADVAPEPEEAAAGPGSYESPTIKFIVQLTIVSAAAAALGAVGVGGFTVVSTFMEALHISPLIQATMGALYELIFSLFSGITSVASSSLEIGGAIGSSTFRGASAIAQVIPPLVNTLSVGGPMVALGRYAGNLKRLTKDMRRTLRRARAVQGRVVETAQEMRANLAERIVPLTEGIDRSRALVLRATDELTRTGVEVRGRGNELFDRTVRAVCGQIDRSVVGYNALSGVVMSMVGYIEETFAEQTRYAALEAAPREESPSMELVRRSIGRVRDLLTGVRGRLAAMPAALPAIPEEPDAVRQRFVSQHQGRPFPEDLVANAAARGAAQRREWAELAELRKRNPEEADRRFAAWKMRNDADIARARAESPESAAVQDAALERSIAHDAELLAAKRRAVDRLRAIAIPAVIPAEILQAHHQLDGLSQTQLENAFGNMPPPPPRPPQAAAPLAPLLTPEEADALAVASGRVTPLGSPARLSPRPFAISRPSSALSRGSSLGEPQNKKMNPGPDTPRPPGGGKRSRKNRRSKRKKSRRR
jgi:hypothetical protein